MTLDKLKRRGRACANRCFQCGENEESIVLILIHFSNVRELWTILFAFMGVDWILPYSVRDLVLWWKGAFMRKRTRKFWMAAPLCLF